MSQRRTPLPPPWCLILLGAFFLYLAREHYFELSEFEAGRIDRMFMYTFMILIYDTLGFWPTAIFPFVAAGAVLLAGVSLQIRDLRARARGESPALSYDAVRWKGLFSALLVVVGVIAAFAGLAWLLWID